MSLEGLRRKIKTEAFDHQILEYYLSDFKKPRDKISSLLADFRQVFY